MRSSKVILLFNPNSTIKHGRLPSVLVKAIDSEKLKVFRIRGCIYADRDDIKDWLLGLLDASKREAN